jgi:cathepsin F
MNLLRLTLSLHLVLTAVFSEDYIERKFLDWQRKYHKTYESDAVLLHARRNFEVSVAYIESIQNSSSSFMSWEMELGKFADMSVDEFSEKMLMASRFVNSSETRMASLNNVYRPASHVKDVPASFDWRYDGNVKVVTSVKDQGTVGTCWAFSTIGNVEGQWALSGRPLIDLSPEYLVDCDGTSDAANNHADCSIFGGWPYLAYDFIISSGGLPSDADWPYCSGSGECYPCMQGPINICGPPPYYCDKEITERCKQNDWSASAKIGTWNYVDSNEDIILESLFEHGPLSVLLDASQLQYYKGGIWTGHMDAAPSVSGCKQQEMNHAVLLVGYGVDVDADNVETPYWVVKNSWGESWGEDGYFRILRNANTCGIANEVTTSII